MMPFSLDGLINIYTALQKKYLRQRHKKIESYNNQDCSFWHLVFHPRVWSKCFYYYKRYSHYKKSSQKIRKQMDALFGRIKARVASDFVNGKDVDEQVVRLIRTFIDRLK